MRDGSGADTVRGEFSFDCSNRDCPHSFHGDDLATLAESVAYHWNKEHGDELRHNYEAIDEVVFGGHHIQGNSYEVRKYNVYITSFDVMQRIGQMDGYAVPSDSELVCDECLRQIPERENRIEEAPDDAFNDEWTCRACIKEAEIERKASENQSLVQYVADTDRSTRGDGE